MRAALLTDPAVALRLTLAHMIGGSALWQLRPDPQATRKEETAESVAGSAAQAAFETERIAVLELLGFESGDHTVTRSNGDDWGVAATFAKLLDLADVMRVLTFVMAETLEAGTCVIEQVGCHLAVDMSASYAPDDALFDLIRAKPLIGAMLAEVGGKAVADAHVSATGKAQKGIIRDFLGGTNDRKQAQWLPRYFRFPFASYTPEGAGRLTANAAKAAQVMVPAEE